MLLEGEFFESSVGLEHFAEVDGCFLADGDVGGVVDVEDLEGGVVPVEDGSDSLEDG